MRASSYTTLASGQSENRTQISGMQHQRNPVIPIAHFEGAVSFMSTSPAPETRQLMSLAL